MLLFFSKSSTFKQKRILSKLYFKHMRVLDPPKHEGKPKIKKKRQIGVSKPIIVFIVCAIIGGITFYFIASRRAENTASTSIELPVADAQTDDPFDITKKPLKKLQGDQFKELYQSVVLPNTQEITELSTITGNDGADARIRKLAEDRGYRLSRIPMGAIVRLEDEPRLDTDDLLQPLAAESWKQMRDAARRAGYPLSLLSAYRSPQYQQGVFLDRLYAQGVTAEQIASGAADGAVQTTLQLTAVPGYSRHHTGYTIDLWCEDESTSFLSSSCYKWVSSSGYVNAMEYGWIPSYPEGASEQGPEPEPWEYVWVGDAARE
jgi:LAS superfamily LD-carboxypeptidase LdcB